MRSNRGMKRTLAILAAAAGVLLSASPVAGAQGAVVVDPIGDAVAIGSVSAPAYQDMVMVTVDKQAGRFEFSTTLAGPIPTRPVMPARVKELWWLWALDINPATFPTGYPRGPGLALAPEFLLAVAWDGIEYRAFVVDRRPTLIGGEHIIVPVAFQITDTRVTAFVGASTLDDPASFRFSAATREWMGPPGTEAFVFTDYTGTPGTFHPWPGE
jgi:hypothetical protein